MTKRRSGLLLFALFAALIPALTVVSAQEGSERVVSAKGYISASAIRPGDKFKVAVVLDVAQGYHINAHTPTLDYLVATNVVFTPPPGVKVGAIKYPEPEHKSFEFSPDTKLAVHEGAIVIIAEAEAIGDLNQGSPNVAAVVTVQACNDALCLAPGEVKTDIPIQVAAKGTAISQANEDVFAGRVVSAGASASGGELREFSSGARKDTFGEFIEASGLPLALVTVFLAGLALNLTPCVFPIIPITVGFFVNQAASEGKPRLGRTFLMAAMYTLGMAITYSLLGVIASMTGGLFGAALQSPIVLIVLAGVMTVLALSMFGVYEFRMPEFLNRFANSSTQSTSGVIGALVMGLTMGIVAAPCIGPVVLGFLVHVSAKADPLYGFLIFFVMALGLGLPYLILGTFSGAIKALPRSGEWMITVRKIFGLVLIGMALYFLMPLMGQYTNYIFVAFFVLSALYLIFWEAGRAKPGLFAWVLRGLGAAAVVAAIVMALPPKVEAEIPWQPYSEAAVSAARKEGKAVIIDVYADWCIPCKELDKLTFTDADVKREAERFVTLKLDLTRNDPATDAGRARKRFDIIGVPTVLFLDAEGKEEESLRLTGFEKPALFVSRMKRVASPPAGENVLAANAAGEKAVVADAVVGSAEAAPAASMNLLEGGTVDLASLRGKVVLLDFWATWCVPCLAEIPTFNQLYAAHKSKGFELVAVSLDDEGAEKVRPFVKEHPMKYTVAIGDAALAASFKVDDSALPVTFLIDKQGRIRFTHIGVTTKEVFEGEINQLLAE